MRSQFCIAAGLAGCLAAAACYNGTDVEPTSFPDAESTGVTTVDPPTTTATDEGTTQGTTTPTTEPDSTQETGGTTGTSGVSATEAETTQDSTTTDASTTDAESSSTTTPPDPPCGNGECDLGEVCDDGNTVNGDGCESNCMAISPLDRCGNREIGWNETCDSPQGAGCTAACGISSCGDGVEQPGEQCDDGANLDNTDGCTAGCKSVAVCPKP